MFSSNGNLLRCQVPKGGLDQAHKLPNNILITIGGNLKARGWRLDQIKNQIRAFYFLSIVSTPSGKIILIVTEKCLHNVLLDERVPLLTILCSLSSNKELLNFEKKQQNPHAYHTVFLNHRHT
jgi:hypothetical protein